jgi:hypothetical protein
LVELTQMSTRTLGSGSQVLTSMTPMFIIWTVDKQKRPGSVAGFGDVRRERANSRRAILARVRPCCDGSGGRRSGGEKRWGSACVGIGLGSGGTHVVVWSLSDLGSWTIANNHGQSPSGRSICADVFFWDAGKRKHPATHQAHKCGYGSCYPPLRYKRGSSYPLHPRYP